MSAEEFLCELSKLPYKVVIVTPGLRAAVKNYLGGYCTIRSCDGGVQVSSAAGDCYIIASNAVKMWEGV